MSRSRRRAILNPCAHGTPVLTEPDDLDRDVEDVTELDDLDRDVEDVTELDEVLEQLFPRMGSILHAQFLYHVIPEHTKHKKKNIIKMIIGVISPIYIYII